jgi:hypothetical protein
MELGFVIGNGISRRSQPLEKLKQHGTVYACNYAATEIPCDHAIAVDRAMVFDIISQHNNNYAVWSRQKWCNVLKHPTPLYSLPMELYPPLTRWDLERHWGSGTHAVWKAAEDNNGIVVLLGFDLWHNGTNNNLYASRDHYNANPVDPGCWIHQLHEVFKRHPDTTFVSIQEDQWKVPEEWQDLENFSIDSYSNLWNWLDNI